MEQSGTPSQPLEIVLIAQIRVPFRLESTMSIFRPRTRNSSPESFSTFHLQKQAFLKRQSGDV
jgi:hypothetical protein